MGEPMGGKVVRLMKALIASGILFLLAFASIGLAGGFVPLWDDHPWECGEFCSYQPSIATALS